MIHGLNKLPSAALSLGLLIAGLLHSGCGQGEDQAIVNKKLVGTKAVLTAFCRCRRQTIDMRQLRNYESVQRCKSTAFGVDRPGITYLVSLMKS